METPQRRGSRFQESPVHFLTPSSRDNLLDEAPLTFEEVLLKRQYELGKHGQGGKHSDVFFAIAHSDQGTREIAVKKQVIKDAGSLDDRAYREVVVLKQLAKLRNMPTFYPSGVSNFIGAIDWFKCPSIFSCLS